MKVSVVLGTLIGQSIENDLNVGINSFVSFTEQKYIILDHYWARKVGQFNFLMRRGSTSAGPLSLNLCTFSDKKIIAGCQF